MEQNPSWEANSFLASQEIPYILLGSLPHSQQPTIFPSCDPVINGMSATECW
jgi:hypothetical protein